jgi:hypothetical protein
MRWKLHVRSIVDVKNRILPILPDVAICEGAVTLWRHSDVIWGMLVITLVSLHRGNAELYIGTKYNSIRRLLEKIQGGDCNPPLVVRVTKNGSDEG